LLELEGKFVCAAAAATMIAPETIPTPRERTDQNLTTRPNPARVPKRNGIE